MGDDSFPWVNANLNENTQVGKAARVFSHWGKDWHKELLDPATYEHAHNDILDLVDTITELLAKHAALQAQVASLELTLAEVRVIIEHVDDYAYAWDDLEQLLFGEIDEEVADAS